MFLYIRKAASKILSLEWLQCKERKENYLDVQGGGVVLLNLEVSNEAALGKFSKSWWTALKFYGPNIFKS